MSTKPGEFQICDELFVLIGADPDRERAAALLDKTERALSGTRRMTTARIECSLAEDRFCALLAEHLGLCVDEVHDGVLGGYLPLEILTRPWPGLRTPDQRR